MWVPIYFYCHLVYCANGDIKSCREECTSSPVAKTDLRFKTEKECIESLYTSKEEVDVKKNIVKIIKSRKQSTCINRSALEFEDKIIKTYRMEEK